MGHHRLKAAAGASPADPYFSSTSLLLLGNGTNGGQNNTFVDSSANNFTITRNGNTTQGSFSPFSAPDGRWSNYFDGSGDYLEIADNSAFTLGSGSMTLEAWICPMAFPSSGAIANIAAQWTFTTTNQAWLFAIYNNSGTIQLIWQPTSGSTPTGIAYDYAFSIGVWYHVAAVKNGSTVTLYVNGSSIGSTTYSSTVNDSTTPLTIGSRVSGGLPFTGNISNLRFVVGSAVYTANFTPSISPLTAVTNTQLLTCQSNRFLDNSSNAFAITPYGNAAVTSVSPFAPLAEYSAGSNGGSGYFDGSSDYLSVASSAAFALGTGDFTVECWVYWTSTSSNADSLVNVNASGGFSFYWDGGTYATNKLVVSNRIANQFSESFTPTAGTWYHFVVSRVSSNFRVWVNGTQLGTTATVTTNYAQGDCQIGGTTDGSTWSINGYISSLRIVKGSGVTSVTVPTAPLTAITNTSLLLNFTNASIIDSTAKNDLETVGDAQISTSVKKFGTGSLKFDGTGDYLSIPDSANFDLPADFTVECWINLSSTSNPFPRVFSFGTYNAANNLDCSIDTSTQYLVVYFNGTQYDSGTSTINFGTWYHIAIVRSGSTIKAYVDGTVKITISSATAAVQRSQPFYVGNLHGFESSTTAAFNGYIDDLRITKGVARYTSNFTPPSAQLPSR
jgi:hypothetical protein